MKNRSHQQGVGLIEVLVTLLILSTSLITLTAMQNRSLQFNQMSYFRSQANILAYDILDRIRTNKSSIPNNLAAYNVALAPFGGGAAPGGVIQTDIFLWRQEIDARIPGGQGAIACVNATNICNVTISWNEINSTLRLTDAQESTSLFIYSARL